MVGSMDKLNETALTAAKVAYRADNTQYPAAGGVAAAISAYLADCEPGPVVTPTRDQLAQTIRDWFEDGRLHYPDRWKHLADCVLGLLRSRPVVTPTRNDLAMAIWRRCFPASELAWEADTLNKERCENTADYVLSLLRSRPAPVTPQLEVTDQDVDDACMTWRHDFGLLAPDDDESTQLVYEMRKILTRYAERIAERPRAAPVMTPQPFEVTREELTTLPGAQFYSIDEEGQLETHATAKDARDAAESALECDGEWDEGVGGVEWGVLVPFQEARETDRVEPDENSDDERAQMAAANGWAYHCNYVLTDTSLAKRPRPVPAEGVVVDEATAGRLYDAFVSAGACRDSMWTALRAVGLDKLGGAACLPDRDGLARRLFTAAYPRLDWCHRTTDSEKAAYSQADCVLSLLPVPRTYECHGINVAPSIIPDDVAQLRSFGEHAHMMWLETTERADTVERELTEAREALEDHQAKIAVLERHNSHWEQAAYDYEQQFKNATTCLVEVEGHLNDYVRRFESAQARAADLQGRLEKLRGCVRNVMAELNEPRPDWVRQNCMRPLEFALTATAEQKTAEPAPAASQFDTRNHLRAPAQQPADASMRVSTRPVDPGTNVGNARLTPAEPAPSADPVPAAHEQLTKRVEKLEQALRILAWSNGQAHCAARAELDKSDAPPASDAGKEPA
jgi:hypothetical protein